MNRVSDAPASASPLPASQSLLTKTLTAGKGNSMALPTPGLDGVPKNAIVHGQCGRWWTGAERSHASCCHRTFSSLSAFDLHRKGGRCNDPAEMGLVARDKPFGELWGWPAPVGGYGTLHADRDDTTEEAA